MRIPPEYLSHASVELRRWRAADAELACRLVRESLEHLRPWMPWATDSYGLADVADYVRRCEDSWADGSAVQYLVLAGGHPAAAALTQAAFALPGIDHVEIHHDALNLASERVPAKLGFSPAGTGPARFELAPGDSGTTKVWRTSR